jgi:hypothetical protein
MWNQRGLPAPVVAVPRKTAFFRSLLETVATLCTRDYDFPIKTPVMNTSTPPSPTCNAAEIQGVSM